MSGFSDLSGNLAAWYSCGCNLACRRPSKNAACSLRIIVVTQIIIFFLEISRKSWSYHRLVILNDYVPKFSASEAIVYIHSHYVLTEKKPIFLLHAALMIPNVSVKPTLDEIQEVLVLAGKHISGLSKGVTQWSGGKTSRVYYIRNIKRFFELCTVMLLGTYMISYKGIVWQYFDDRAYLANSLSEFIPN